MLQKVKAANAKDAKRKAAEKELQMFCNQTGRHPIGRYFFCSDNKKSAARSNGFFRFYTLVADLRQMQTLDIFAQIQKPPKMRDFWLE